MIKHIWPAAKAVFKVVFVMAIAFFALVVLVNIPAYFGQKFGDFVAAIVIGLEVVIVFILIGAYIGWQNEKSGF